MPGIVLDAKDTVMSKMGLFFVLFRKECDGHFNILECDE